MPKFGKQLTDLQKWNIFLLWFLLSYLIVAKTDSDMSAKIPTIGQKQNAKSQIVFLMEYAPKVWLQRKKLKNANDLDSLLRFIIGIMLAIILFFIVCIVLYSLVFVTQPMENQAPNDAEFFKLITPIATFIVGALSTIMVGSKSEKKD